MPTRDGVNPLALASAGGAYLQGPRGSPKLEAAVGARHPQPMPRAFRACRPPARPGELVTLLIRHAESVWNEHFGSTRIDIGLPDPPLTARGIEQARQAAERLRGERIRRLITSPYRRTLQTAAILAKAFEVPVTVDPTVRERCAFSCDQGTAPGELAREWPELDFAGLDDLWWGGVIESWPSLAARCAEFRARIAMAPDRDEVVVVSHWGFIRGLTGAELHNTDSIRLAHDASHPDN